MDEVGLIKLKQQIETAKTQTAELKGQLNALMKQLKDDWKCDTVEEAEALLDKMSADIDALNTQIQQGLTELEEKYQQ